MSVKTPGGEAAPKDVFMARTKSFTRRVRDLNPSLEAQFDRVRDDFVIEVPRGIGETTVAEDFRLDVEAAFGRQAPLFVEIGSGRGEQVVAYAAEHPEFDFLAFEVWTPGVARLAVAAAKQGLTNIRVIEADAQQALPFLLEEGTVHEVWTFFPDPWRKARHHKRRIISLPFTPVVARLLEDGGVWRMATDWENYAEQMLEVMSAAPDFVLEDRDDTGQPTFSPRFEGRVETHFEKRGQEAGRPSWDITALRVPRPTSEKGN